MDLAPTLLDWFDLPAAGAQCAGKSLLPLLDAARGVHREAAFLGVGSGVRGMRTADFLYRVGEIDPKTGETIEQLFMKPVDRWDANDVLRHYPDVAAEMALRLKQFVEFV